MKPQCIGSENFSRDEQPAMTKVFLGNGADYRQTFLPESQRSSGAVNLADYGSD
jgi:hypothetical protein